MWHHTLEKHKTFFTSDLHLCHKNMAKGTSKWKDGYRDFNDSIEMSNVLIENINKIVKKDDILVHLGDFYFGLDDLYLHYRNRINCHNIINIYGNHDKRLRKNKNLQKAFIWVGDYLEVYVGEQLICLSHYSFNIWNKSHHGSWMLYGHSHGSLPDDITKRSIDVGVDTQWQNIHRRYYPYSFDELDEIMLLKRPEVIDHHTGER